MEETAASSELASWTNGPTVEELERRVQRLEDVVAAMCDTQALEERVRAHLVEQLRKEPIQLEAKPVEPPPAQLASAALPMAVLAHVYDAAVAANNSPPASNEQIVATTPAVSNWAALTLLGEIWWETRTLYRMLRDRLYPRSWMAWLALGMLIVYVLWHYFIGFYFFPIEMVVFILGTYVGLKMVGRELRRYDAFISQRRR